MAELRLKIDQSELNNFQEWLAQLKHDDDDPDLQPDAQDIENLLLLKRQNEESEKNLTEEINLKKTLIHSINSKTGEMKSLLKSEDVCLSEDAWRKVESVAELAAKMNVEKIDLTNLLLGVCSMKNEKMKTEEDRMNNCALMSSYSRQNLKIRRSNDVLQSHLESLAEVVGDQESKKVKISESINFFNTKSKEYEHSVRINKEKLKGAKYEKSLQHSNLVEESKRIEILEEKLKTSLEKLKNYKKLPPNEKLTQLKVREKKEELMQMEKEFMNLLDKWEKHNDVEDVPH